MATEVEVATIAQVREALKGEPSWIMLDNMAVPQLAEAVRLRRELVPAFGIRAGGLGHDHLGRPRLRKRVSTPSLSAR